MTFVYHHQRVILFCEIANFVDGSHVAVHREHTIGHDDTEALLLCSLQLAFEIFHICVGITITLSFAKAHTINDRSMVEGVGDDGIFCCEQRFKHTTVCIEASSIEDSIVCLEET